ncbi:Homocysteine S-methyltransferase [Syncephalastrum racemosum]|uniref:Homocysteine S-methyltransferase n=1 Tax=Syncephalastrum racemosum TaxID=13706 RepID=A0A1X2HL33_SYNRA|nr:Homocysteine S-methyltransferase [Syncephalastrum racemosum]
MSFSYPLILDGGLATQLERAHNKDLSGRLWSAVCLEQDPDAIRSVHEAYFAAGAQIATTASYQASVPGLTAAGYSEEQARQLLKRSVNLAREATAQAKNKGYVALSLGCYGALLANGAEYTGDYGDKTMHDLVAFHRDRLQPGVDLVLFETVPSKVEAEAIVALLPEIQVPVGVSFVCKDNQHLADGNRLAECLALFRGTNVWAVGVNCTKPVYIPALVEQLDQHLEAQVALLVYPDGGQIWDAVRRDWINAAVTPHDFAASVVEAVRPVAGHRKLVLGGCCGTGPEHIQKLKEEVSRISDI